MKKSNNLVRVILFSSVKSAPRAGSIKHTIHDIEPLIFSIKCLVFSNKFEVVQLLCTCLNIFIQ